MALFIGNVRRGEYETLHDRGLAVGLLYDELCRSRFARLADLDLVLPWRADLAEDETLRLIREASRHTPLAGVLNVREGYVDLHARLGRRLGFAAVPAHLTHLCLSKRAMLDRLARVLGAAWVAPHAPADTAWDVLRFGEEHGYPLILKPVRLHSSFFVRRIDGPDQVAQVFAEVAEGCRAFARDAGLPHPHPDLQIEGFLAGTLHSVDCLVGHRGTVHTTPVVDVLTGHDIGRDEFFDFARLAPSTLAADDRQAILTLAERGVRALGLRHCAAHAEVIRTPAGPRLVEIAARPGGNRSRLLWAAHGIDLMGPYLAINRHRRPRLAGRDEPGRPFAIVTPFPSVAGTFRSLRGIERVTGLPSYRWHEVTVRPGTRVRPASCGQPSFVHIELGSSDMDQLRRDVAAIAALADLVEVTPEPAGLARGDDPRLMPSGQG